MRYDFSWSGLCELVSDYDKEIAKLEAEIEALKKSIAELNGKQKQPPKEKGEQG